MSGEPGDEDGEQPGLERGVAGDAVMPFEREHQHELPERGVGEDGIDEVG